MNQFKKDLTQGLQSMSLSEEKKQLIAIKAQAKNHGHKRLVNWQYRFVLATFTIFALGFGYLLWKQDESTGRLQGAESIEPAPTINWSILNHDFSKTILLISFFIILRTVIKRRRQKSGKDLPVCIECNEEWTFREALKQSMKNNNITCPYCGHKQYRTKKSALKASLLNISIPFITIVPQLFNHFLLGIVVYLSCVAYLILSLNSYFVELQENDSINETLW